MSDIAQEPQQEGAEAQPEGEVQAEGEGWAGPSQEEWEATQARLAEFEQLVEPGEGDESEEPEFDGEFDPYNPEHLRALMRAEMAPYASYTEEQQLEEANEKAFDIIADLEAANGEFIFRGGDEEGGTPDSRIITRNLAEQFLDETTAKHGPGPKAAEAALKMAYDQVKAYEDAIGTAYHERKMNELRGLANAPREPETAGGVAQAQQLNVPQGGSETDLVRRYFNSP